MEYSCDAQVAERMGIELSLLSPDKIAAWQRHKLRELVAYARTNSPFYAKRYARFDENSGHNFSMLPFLEAKDLQNQPEQLLCVSQDEIARAVSVHSSGTTGAAKRLLYTEDDLEATRDYFGVGMAHLVGRGERAFLLMPAGKSAGVGRLLIEGLQRRGVSVHAHGVMDDVAETVRAFRLCAATTLAGPAAHVHAFAHEWRRQNLPHEVLSVLLCWDATPPTVARNVEKLLQTKVYSHWGMVETGLGGAVQCTPGSGMHLREADLYLEIIDPQTGTVQVDGEYGELVVTTILRRGMPLIRYRTGDHGRILPGDCSCGSPCRRLDPTVRRLKPLLGNQLYDISFYNNLLYTVRGVVDFTVTRTKYGVEIGYTAKSEATGQAVATALMDAGIARESFSLCFQQYGRPACPGLGKRAVYKKEY